MTTPIPGYVSVQDGPRITVNDFIRHPTLIPERVIDITKQGFIVDALLRRSSQNTGGAVVYHESTPIFAGGGGEVVAEFGEIPVGAGEMGIPRVARVQTRGLGIVISEQMRRWDSVDRVNKQIRQVSNGMIASFDGSGLALFGTPGDDTVPDVPVGSGGAWDTTTGKPLTDIGAAKQAIALATDANGEYLGYLADTLVINTADLEVLLSNASVQEIYRGNAAAANPFFTGQLSPLRGLDILPTPRMTAGNCLVLQRKTVGAIIDDRAMRATEVYLWKREAETWRSDVTRASVMFLDEPKSACWITGITT